MMNKAKARGQPEPETRVGHCCGNDCGKDNAVLYKVPNIYRYRCEECFPLETGFRHHLMPILAPKPLIVIP